MHLRPRFVFDTNVIVSAAIFRRSVPALALDKARREGVLLISDSTASELREVLTRKKFDRYLSRIERDAFADALVSQAVVVRANQVISACRDPEDNMLLEVAACGSAERLVTGDADLLALHPFRDIAIVKPQQFLGEPSASQ